VVDRGSSRSVGGGFFYSRVGTIYGEVPRDASFLFHHGSKRGNGDMHGRKRISVVIYGSMRVVSLSFIILYLLVSLSLGYGRS